ncbi:hypothetical protein BN971_03539 [Mycobacterium bohemicum DSM 44277]|uniref:Uncharacterized protein n=1 Tax=Mycobacterium bohemicum DSM 44277 TaxID=1236609 RepID=A0A0U0WD48_MYCBE|nr:hypothetical protein BN971_03539 [Mycobacterium bohemicum DSM 44277]
MLGRQPVVDGDHDRAGGGGVLARGAVVRVEVADDEAAAVEEQHHRAGRAVMRWRPIDPDGDGPGRTGNGPVLDAQLGVHRPAGQVAEPLAGRVDTIVG